MEGYRVPNIINLHVEYSNMSTDISRDQIQERFQNLTAQTARFLKTRDFDRAEVVRKLSSIRYSYRVSRKFGEREFGLQNLRLWEDTIFRRGLASVSYASGHVHAEQ